MSWFSTHYELFLTLLCVRDVHIFGFIERKKAIVTKLPTQNKKNSLTWMVLGKAWQKEVPRCGIGWVLRDQRGRVKWLGAKNHLRLRSVLETKTETLRWAVKMVLSLGYNRVTFE